MKQSRCRQQSRALQTLLAIDDPVALFRLTVNTLPSPQDGRPRAKLPLRLGKENQPYRRQFLPKVNSSKEELKLILRKLESVEPGRSDKDRPLRALRRTENSQSHTCGLKSSRPEGDSESLNPRRERSFVQIEAGDDVRTLMRQQNYSTNALNLKTMHILQQINTKNNRCFSLSAKLAQQSKAHRKNIVAFLRKLA